MKKAFVLSDEVELLGVVTGSVLAVSLKRELAEKKAKELREKEKERRKLQPRDISPRFKISSVELLE